MGHKSKVPAAAGTADYDNRSIINTNGDSHSIGESTQNRHRRPQSSSKNKRVESPDIIPPRPYHMGIYTWQKQQRKLDALFAVYVMGWETKANKYNKWRYWIRPLNDNKWESDMLPYYHDDLRLCYEGLEKLRSEGIYLTVETMEDGYEVVEATMKLSVRNVDLTFAMMAVCLLIRGVSHNDIQFACSEQDDWTNRAKARKYNET